MSRDWNVVAKYFEGDAVAHMATLMADGGPHVVPVWIGRHGESELAVFMVDDSLKDRNLQRDPRVAFSITRPENPLDMATVRAEVVQRITGEPAMEIVDRISRQYTGEDYDVRTGMTAFVLRPTRAWANSYSD